MSAHPSSALETSITQVITQKMAKVMDNVLKKDPDVMQIYQAKDPLYSALVPDEIFKGSHFEKRFSVSFDTIWKELAVVIAKHWMGNAEGEYSVVGKVPQKRLARIQETLNRSAYRRSSEATRPDWDSELEYILEADGNPIPTRVVCDLCVEDVRSNEKFCLEIKTPFSNFDQARSSKEALLKLYAMKPRLIDHAYYAIPFDPFRYKTDLGPSSSEQWFDLRRDKCVLIGDELWNMLGGEITCELLLNIVRRLGQSYRNNICERYLGIAPSKNGDCCQFQDIQVEDK